MPQVSTVSLCALTLGIQGCTQYWLGSFQNTTHVKRRRANAPRCEHERRRMQGVVHLVKVKVSLLLSIAQTRSRCVFTWRVTCDKWIMQNFVAFTGFKITFFQTCSNLPVVFKNQDVNSYLAIEIDWKYWTKTAFNGQDIAGCIYF